MELDFLFVTELEKAWNWTNDYKQLDKVCKNVCCVWHCLLSVSVEFRENKTPFTLVSFIYLKPESRSPDPNLLRSSHYPSSSFFQVSLRDFCGEKHLKKNLSWDHLDDISKLKLPQSLCRCYQISLQSDCNDIL